MARSLAKITVAIWEDPDFVALPGSAQRLYLVLLSQRRLSLVGRLDLRARAWARLAADGTVDAVLEDLERLEQARFVAVDHDTDEVLIRTFVRHDVPAGRMNVNLLKGLWSAYDSIDSPALRQVAVDNLPDHIWTDGRCAPHPDALARSPRSAQTEPTVRTNGSDRPSEPPLTSHLSPSTSHLPRPDDLATDQPGPGLDQEARSARLAAAAELLTERHLAEVPSRNRHHHRAAVLRGKVADHQLAAHRLLLEHPDLTPADLADLLEPAPAAHPTPAPYEPEPIVGNRETNLAALAALRASAAGAAS